MIFLLIIKRHYHSLHNINCEISDIYIISKIQTEKAIAISKKALKTNPDCIRANYQLAKYYSRNDIRISVQYYHSIILQNKNFGKYIVSKIISLAKELRSSAVILKTLTAVSQTKDIPFIPDVYFLFFMKKIKNPQCIILILLIEGI